MPELLPSNPCQVLALADSKGKLHFAVCSFVLGLGLSERAGMCRSCWEASRGSRSRWKPCISSANCLLPALRLRRAVHGVRKQSSRHVLAAQAFSSVTDHALPPMAMACCIRSLQPGQSFISALGQEQHMLLAGISGMLVCRHCTEGCSRLCCMACASLAAVRRCSCALTA